MVAGAVVLCCGERVRSETRVVPSEFATINGALDVSALGDTVLVEPGVYEEYETRMVPGQVRVSSIGFLRSGVILRSLSGPRDTVLRLTATDAQPIALAGFGVAERVLVEGFSFTGTAVGLIGVKCVDSDGLLLRDCVFHDFGAGLADACGIWSVRSDLMIQRCRFERINGGQGGGIRQTSGVLEIEDCTFRECRHGAVWLYREYGLPHSTALEMRRCHFLGNVQAVGYYAGAITSWNYGQSVIEESWFEDNVNESPATDGGGAIEIVGSAVVRNNSFVGNQVTYGRGGAIMVLQGSPAVVTGNTFLGNSAPAGWLDNGSSVWSDGACELRNNIIAGSVGSAAVGGYGASDIVMNCNVFWANEGGNAIIPLSPSDLVADPLFCDAPALDLTVNAASPCLPGNGHEACAALIGAWGQGCGAVSLEQRSWGRMKAGFR